MQLGITSTTFRQIRSTQKIIATAKKAGCEAIEWGGDIHVKSVQKAQMVAEQCKGQLRIHSYGSYYVVGSNNTAMWLNICKIANAMGAKTVRVWLGKKGSAKTTEQQFNNMIADARSMCKVAKGYNLTIAPECHGGTYNDNTDAFLHFAEVLQVDNFKTYFQSIYKNLQYDLDRLERTLPYIDTVHISYSEQFRMQIFAKKDKKYIDKLMAKLKELGFNGMVLLEYTYFGLPSCSIKCCNKLQKLIRG